MLYTLHISVMRYNQLTSFNGMLYLSYHNYVEKIIIVISILIIKEEEIAKYIVGCLGV